MQATSSGRRNEAYQSSRVITTATTLFLVYLKQRKKDERKVKWKRERKKHTKCRSCASNCMHCSEVYRSHLLETATINLFGYSYLQNIYLQPRTAGHFRKLYNPIRSNPLRSFFSADTLV